MRYKNVNIKKNTIVLFQKLSKLTSLQTWIFYRKCIYIIFQWNSLDILSVFQSRFQPF